MHLSNCKEGYSFNSKTTVFHYGRQHLPKKIQYLNPISFCAVGMLRQQITLKILSPEIELPYMFIRPEHANINQTFLAGLHFQELIMVHLHADHVISFVSNMQSDTVWLLRV